MTQIQDIDKSKIIKALHSARKTLKQQNDVLLSSIKKFDAHTKTVIKNCDVTDSLLSEEIFEKIKSCISKKSAYYARDCVTPYLKDICINIRAEVGVNAKLSGDGPLWHDLHHTYIPFPNPNIWEQFKQQQVQIDLFHECFNSYVPEHSLSKFSNFFSPQCYISFNDYQALLDEFQ